MGDQFGAKKGGQFGAKIHGQLPAESGDLFKRNFHLQVLNNQKNRIINGYNHLCFQQKISGA
jgi:hypothetical protein